MDTEKGTKTARAIVILCAAMLMTGCNFWGLDDLKIVITSPTSDTTITAGESVSFASEVSFGTSPYTYAWDFGNGTTSAVQNPGSITFSTAGTYTVTVTVTDNDGSTAEDSIIITVNSSTGFTASITSPSGAVQIIAGQSVTFQSSVSNGTSPYTYLWNFGGGATNSTLQNPGTVIFSTAGTYTVKLTVTDNNGNTAEDTVVVTVL